MNQNIQDIYAPLSWHCLVGGYGNYPAATKADPRGAAMMAEVERFVSGCAANFPNHRDALAALFA